MECWIKGSTSSSAQGGGSPIFAVTPNNDVSYWTLALSCRGNNEYYVFADDNSGSFTATNLLDENWHHIAMTRSGSRVRVHVDGVLKYNIDRSVSYQTNLKLYCPIRYSSRNDYSMIQFIMYSYAKYNENNFTPSREVIDIS